jgi:hypothetical protein
MHATSESYADVLRGTPGRYLEPVAMGTSTVGRFLHRTRQVVVVFASFCVFVVG